MTRRQLHHAKGHDLPPRILPPLYGADYAVFFGAHFDSYGSKLRIERICATVLEAGSGAEASIGDLAAFGPFISGPTSEGWRQMIQRRKRLCARKTDLLRAHAAVNRLLSVGFGAMDTMSSSALGSGLCKAKTGSQPWPIGGIGMIN